MLCVTVGRVLGVDARETQSGHLGGIFGDEFARRTIAERISGDLDMFICLNGMMAMNTRPAI